MRMGMTIGVHLAITVPVMTGGNGVEVDTRLLEGGFGFGSVAFRVVAGEPAPWLHWKRTPRPAARPALVAPRARYACIHRV